MGTVRRGRGRPLTLFVPGGEGENLVDRMRYLDRVAGAKIGFAYEQSGTFETFARIRRQADRDAAEVRAVASQQHVTRAVGFSRGARDRRRARRRPQPLRTHRARDPTWRTRAAGKYATWLESLPTVGRVDLPAEVLVVGHRGDQGHPARVAQTWAQQLNARLELLTSRAVYTDAERVARLLADFLD